MSILKRSNEPGEELYRVKSDPPPAGDDPHAAATKVGSMLVEQLMREAERTVGAPPPRSKPPLPPRPDQAPKSGLRPSEIPRVADEVDLSLEPTLIAESPPDSVKACATGDVDAEKEKSADAGRPGETNGKDVIAAIVKEMSRASAASDGAIPKLSSDEDEDEKLVTEKGTELMAVRPEQASHPSMSSSQRTVAVAGPKAAFPDWIGVSMKFDPLEDRRRELMVRAAIALGAFVITAAVLLWVFLG